MANTLGQIIGVVKHTFSVTNDNKEKVQLSINFDFRSCTDSDIRSWLCGNRAIVWQRPARAMSASAIRKCDGITVDASKAGHKPESQEAKVRAGIAALRAMGMTEKADEIEAELEAKLAEDNETEDNE